MSTPVVWTAALGMFIVIHSLLFSPLSAVSLLKALSWTTAAATMFAAWSGLKRGDRAGLEAQVFGGLIAVLALSLPLVGADVGYLRNGTGFQGILNHPQAFGPTMALLASWLAGGLLTATKPSWIRGLGLVVAVVAVVLSEARTAGLALMGGVLLGALGTILATKTRLVVVLPGLRSSRAMVWALVASAGLLVTGPVLVQKMSGFLQKRGAAVSALEVYETSRGALIRRMWVNIEVKPMEGIGFGIASDPASMVLVNAPLLGLPSGAAIEKGVMPIAVMEELGIPGALAVFAWLAMLLRRALRTGFSATCVLCTALLTNLGEYTLFSAGGMGMLVLIVVTWASSVPTAAVVVKQAGAAIGIGTEPART